MALWNRALTEVQLKRFLLYGQFREWARWIESCTVIGYPSGQDGAILPGRDYPPCPQEQFPQNPYYKSFIDQACSVKIGWILALFTF